jgi:hypothetical protein
MRTVYVRILTYAWREQTPAPASLFGETFDYDQAPTGRTLPAVTRRPTGTGSLQVEIRDAVVVQHGVNALEPVLLLGCRHVGRQQPEAAQARRRRRLDPLSQGQRTARQGGPRRRHRRCSDRWP